MNFIKNKSIKNNITTDYLFAFLKNFDLTRSIWVLYLVYQGMSLWQVGLLEGIFHLSGFLFEIPTGAIADLFGRKKSLIAGRFFFLLSCLLMLFSHDFWGFAFSFILSALSYNLNSGSEEALVYDSLLQLNESERYLKINSRLNLILEVAQTISMFLGGVLAEKSFYACYVAASILAILSACSALLFIEPSLPLQHKEEKNTLKQHIILSYHIMKSNREILHLMLYFPIVFTFATVSFFYGQQYFSSMGFNKIEISIFLLLQSCGGLLTVFYCEKIVSALGNKAKYVASILMGFAIFLFASHVNWICVLAFILIGASNALLYPIQSNSLNALIPSGQRATILSVDSMIFSAFMVVVFPLCGLLADQFGFPVMFTLLAILQLSFMGILLKKKKDKIS